MMNRIVYKEFSSEKELNLTELNDYSLFKHGVVKPTKIFAKRLAKCIVEDIILNDYMKDDIVIIGAPYNKVPVASTFLAFYVAKYITQYTGKIIKLEKVNRMHSYHDDYGSMPLEQREKSLSGESFTINSDNLKGKRVYFIDDIYITGSHEKRMIGMLNKSNVEFNYKFCYYLKLSDSTCCPTVENLLNNNFINITRIAVLNQYVTDKKALLINTRVTKLIMRSEETIFAHFLLKASPETLFNLYLACKANEYNKHSLYIKNYNTLNALYEI